MGGVRPAGVLKLVAIFDKPDRLDGPFFEETIYLTPSRESADLQREIERTVAAGAAALGLRHGPFHAECRVNDSGLHLLRVPATSLRGPGSKALRYTSPGGDASLHAVLHRHPPRPDA